MTDWEQSLRTIAHGANWDVPSLAQARTSLMQLQTILAKAASDTGLNGSAGLSASESLDTAKKDLQDLIDYLDPGNAAGLPAAITAANAARDRAASELANLGAGGLSASQTAAIRGAEVGATVVLGPISVVAGEGAIGLANWFLGNQRSEQARTSVEAVTTDLDTARDMIADPPAAPGEAGAHTGGTPGTDSPSSDGGTPGGPGTSSFTQYPDYNVSLAPTASGGGSAGSGVSVSGHGAFVYETPAAGGGTVSLTPDGPVSGGGTTVPGGSGSGGLGGSGVSVGSGSGGLLGGGVSNGLIAGAGGAAVLGGLGKAAGLVGGAGGFGRVGAGGLTADAAGTSAARGGSGGLLGKSGGSTGGTAASAEGSAQARGTAGLAGGGAGAQGARGGKDDKRRRGLGGPVAPKLDDDEEYGAWSENAGAGGRD